MQFYTRLRHGSQCNNYLRKVTEVISWIEDMIGRARILAQYKINSGILVWPDPQMKLQGLACKTNALLLFKSVVPWLCIIDIKGVMCILANFQLASYRSS